MGSSSVQQVPNDPNLGSVQNNENSAINSLGQYTAPTQQIYYNEVANQNAYAPAAQQAATNSANSLNSTAATNQQNASYFSGVPSQLQPYINQTLQTAYDPQQALYSQNLASMQDATNANLAQSGLQYSPWAAGVQATNLNQFNTNWLQTQLGREQTGADTVSSLLGSSTSAANEANTLGTNAAQQIYQAGLLPYQTAEAFNQNLAAAVPYLTSNQQQQIADYNAYYTAANANNANQVAAGSAIDKTNLAVGQGIGSLIGTGLGFLTKASTGV